MSEQRNTFFANCPVGWESLLVDEANRLAMDNVKVGHAGVYFDASLMQLYTFCMWSRIASKVFLPVKAAKIETADDAYECANALDWPSLFDPKASIRVDFLGSNDEIRNTQFGAQKIKDAIVDKIVYLGHERPVIDKVQPDLRIQARLHKDELFLSLDLCGESLHKRGYRKKQGSAPLKETLAAAILYRLGMHKYCEENKKFTLLDPMCGSGTFLIEGAQIALDIAPSLTRELFSFKYWTGHSEILFNNVCEDALKRKRQALENYNSKNDWQFIGSDTDAAVLDCAKENITAAGLDEVIRLSIQDASTLSKPTAITEHGLVVTNPPYGERLGQVEELRLVYQQLAQSVKRHFQGWQFALFTSNPELASETRMRASKKNKFRNGPLHAELFLYNIESHDNTTLRQGESLLEKPEKILKDEPLSDDAVMIKNRLVKNRKRLKKFISKNELSCYRLYDADMPEYSAAVDIYNDCVHIQEYAAPKTIDEKKAEYRFKQLKHAVAVALNCDNEKLFTKTRRRNKGAQQYENQTQSIGFNKDNCMKVKEGRATFLVNLQDYLDTGLFIDHRPLRLRIANECFNKRFLNLFCYTASASVHAALGGASHTVSVDMSNTYLDWAEENFRLNNLRPQNNQLERADCFTWLDNCREKFDIIMLDPPTFSNSKKMDNVLDIQRDHVKLISSCMNILQEGGLLYFSTNFRKFKIDDTLAERFNVENISIQTIDEDFKQNPKIHYCWKITEK